MNFLRPLFPYLLGLIVVLSTQKFLNIGLINALGQLTLFTFVVCIPIWKTGRMSYVDIGWPWGLVLLGTISFLYSDGYWLRSALISSMVILVGLRMGFGALKLWQAGYLEREFPRYQYQRIIWKEEGKSNTQFALQVDAISQGMANASFLALPILITASNTNESFVLLEFIGMGIWLLALIFESVADFQKLLFLRSMKKAKKYNQVCNIGLWKYCRHPNYFAEWMVWNGIIVLAIPSFLGLGAMEISFLNGELSNILWVLVGIGMIYASRMMYITLVYTTGAIPSEHFSAIKREGYAEYQQSTNRFFPGPKRNI